MADIEVRLIDDEGTVVSAASVALRGHVEPQPIRSRIRLRYRSAKAMFTGRVSSSQNFCERRREVVVKRVRPGRDAVVGRDRTGRDGHFEVARSGRHGRYYAVAKPKGSGFRLCLRADSSTIRLRR